MVKVRARRIEECVDDDGTVEAAKPVLKPGIEEFKRICLLVQLKY